MRPADIATLPLLPEMHNDATLFASGTKVVYWSKRFLATLLLLLGHC